MGDTRFQVFHQETHLGMIRTPKDSSSKLVQENIKKARRSAYSLMSAGLYGYNGVHPRVGIKLWHTYALPVLTYGLEGRRLKLGDVEQLEKCQRRILRSIMNLPKSTAVPALHMMSGVVPVKAILECFQGKR